MVGSLDVSPPGQWTSLLAERFGFTDFLPGQREVIGHLVAGRSAAAVFPTGGGKSLCYQLPALILPGVTLVVSPLIALMKDQIDALTGRQIAAARLDSTLSADEYRGVMEAARKGDLRMLYVAPERFNNERFRETLRGLRVSLLAVDEAHCISEWGHNFRPDYLKLASFARLCRAERLLALTATATADVLKDICRLFEISPQCAVRTGFYRPNLTLRMTSLAAGERDARLFQLLRERPPGPTIVYVTLQRTAEQVAGRLVAQGLDARPYHAGLEDQHRAELQDWFMQSDRAVIVATIAFGMGIDKSNIRYVYHYNLPKSLENYSQEIGRAGRDGQPAICQMIVCPNDLNVLENFVCGDTPGLDNIRGLTDEVLGLGDQFDVSYQELSNRHDIRLLVTRTLLTYLELEGLLEGGTPFYAEYQFKPQMPSAEILSRFSGERRRFLADLFRQATKAKLWFHLDVEAAARSLHAPRERVVRALDYLGEQGCLELQAAGTRHRYRRLQRPRDVVELVHRLYQRMLDREARDIDRVQQVVQLAGHDGCQVSALGAHFGESLAEPCGHCSWCENGRIPLSLVPRAEVAIDETIWRQAIDLRGAHAELLSDARAMTRFLCGLSSPKLTRAKLTRHSLFGALQQVSFPVVLAKITTEAKHLPF